MTCDSAQIIMPSATEPPVIERRRGPERLLGERFAFLLDQIDYGMLVVVDGHRVGYANQAARVALAGRHPLSLLGDDVGAIMPGDAATLRKALDSARRGLRSLLVLGSGDLVAGVAVVPLQPVGEHGGDGGTPGEVLLVIGRNSMWDDLSAQWYARLHGLTGTETQVLSLLCNGVLPSAIARLQGVAVSTIRTQIGSIRAKTGAPTVGAVLRKIAVLPPLVCPMRPAPAAARKPAAATA